MSEKTVPANIVVAIKTEDSDAIRSLFKENPDQIEFYTPFWAQTWLGYAAQIGKLESSKNPRSKNVDFYFWL